MNKNIKDMTFEDKEKSWSAEAWKQEFAHCIQDKKFAFARKLRAEVFQDTIKRVKRGQYISENGKLVRLPSDESMIEHTSFYKNEFAIEKRAEGRCDTKVEVVNEDTLAATKKLVDEGLHPAVLNMANRQNPGGGVYGGAGAQEENLFRRTNLFRSMFQFSPYAAIYGLKMSACQYPLDRNWGGVYTPQACIFRGTEADGYPLLDEPYSADFIAVPAINNPELDGKGMIVPALAEATKNKMRTLFRIAYAKGNDSLVLGALGCGAFGNPPHHVAKLFREVMEEEEFRGAFKKVVFAILDDHNAYKKHNPEGNFKPFVEEFRDFGKEPATAQVPQDTVKLLERCINWILPGCQLFYRDTDADIDVGKTYPLGAVIRAGFFIDVTIKAQRPVTKFRYIIASAHCAKLCEAMDDEDVKRWRLCTLHFNSYFKVMDIYEKDGVTQIFLLHIPYRSVPFFRAENSLNFIQGASQTNLVDVARKSLDTKLQMEVFADTAEPDLLERMHEPVGLDNEGDPVTMDFIIAPPNVEMLSNLVRKMGEDLDEINYPEGQ